MRKIEDVLRLHAQAMSTRRIALATGVGKTTVIEYLRRAAVAGLSWPLPEGLDEEALERRVFPPPPPSQGRQIAAADWAMVHRELKRPGVTLALLWDEYRGQHPDGYGYSAFCEHYRRWVGRLSPVMRQRHVAGERMFVDYSGTRMTVTDPVTGAARPAEIFIAVMGASNMTYAEATWSQALMTDIASYNPAFLVDQGGSALLGFDALIASLTSGRAYLNLHSTEYPGGEIRGFLAPIPLPGAVWLMLAGVAALVAAGRRKTD